MAPSRFSRKVLGSSDAFLRSIDRDRRLYEATQAHHHVYAPTYPLVKQLKVKSLISDNQLDLEVTENNEADTEVSLIPLFEPSEGSSQENDVEMCAADSGADQMTVASDDKGNDTNIEVEPETMEVDLESEESEESEASVDDDPYPAKQALIRELRLKAIGIKDLVIEDWERRKAKIKKLESQDSSKEEVSRWLPTPGKYQKKRQFVASYGKGDIKCPFENCNWFCKTKAQAYRRHLLTHYPEAFFCPICCESYCREDSLDRHFQSGRCLNRADAKRFRVWRNTNGSPKMGLDNRYFNIYFLGAMEDFEITEEEFQIIARRRRHAPLR